MKLLSVFTCLLFFLSTAIKAQPSIQLNYFMKVPVNISNCGALYTYDTVALAKKKYILLTDFQNLGLITVNGKQVKLQLTATKTIQQSNISTYKGAGYTVILTANTTAHKGKLDLEAGTLQVINERKKLPLKFMGSQGATNRNRKETDRDLTQEF